MYRRVSIFQIVFFICLGILAEIANANPFSLPPRFTANAYASDYTVGQADLMLPLQGNAAHNLYIDPSLGFGSDNQGYADLGLGYRWIKNEAAILGGYVFAGYSRLDNNARVWVVNPGIEVMGSRWDGHFNAYFPMGDRSYNVNTYQAFGFFTEHSQFDNLFQVTQNSGIGGDLIAGYQLFPQIPLKAYLGTYAFAPKGGSIVGGAFGMEYWLDSFLKVFAGYTYDNVRHSTGAIGLGVELGGTHIHRSDPSLEERITDPVQRYMAELGQGSKIPTRNNTNTVPFVVANNIAFFSQSGKPNNDGTALTLADCTFENPCGPTDFSQIGVNTLNSLLPNTLLYFNGGSYQALNAAGTTAITLQPGQSIHSRTEDFRQVAMGAGRSTFKGAFDLNSNNTLENIILLPTAATVSHNGVTIDNASNVVITGSQIGSSTAPFNTGALIANSVQAVIANSDIFSSTRGLSVGGTASNTQLNILNSVINTNGTTVSAIILVTDNSIVNILGSQLNATATIATSISGILSTNTNVPPAITSVTLTNTGINISNTNIAYGLHSLGTATIQVTNGNLLVNGNNRSAISRPDAGPNSIQISNSTCMLNSVPGCPA